MCPSFHHPVQILKLGPLFTTYVRSMMGGYIFSLFVCPSEGVPPSPVTGPVPSPVPGTAQGRGVPLDRIGVPPGQNTTIFSHKVKDLKPNVANILTIFCDYL